MVRNKGKIICETAKAKCQMSAATKAEIAAAAKARWVKAKAAVKNAAKGHTDACGKCEIQKYINRHNQIGERS